jgi:hypothetical protein
MTKTIWHYSTGAPINIGDRISLGHKEGVIEEIFSAMTQRAMDFKCAETGGLLLRFEDGDLQVWPYVNEDLVFVGPAKHSA